MPGNQGGDLDGKLPEEGGEIKISSEYEAEAEDQFLKERVENKINKRMGEYILDHSVCYH